MVLSACLLLIDAPRAFSAAQDVQVPSPSADKVKAAYLYNFSKFVSWPSAGVADSLVMCILGAPGVYSFLVHDVDGTLIGQRSVVIRSVSPADPEDDCSLLYVEASAAAAGGNVPKAPPHALTVSDQQDFVRHGGMIELFEAGNRFRFNISLTNARAAGLRVSAPLLQLAAKVDSE